MEPPRHPPGPPFEKARAETDSWRRQQMTALTSEQRRRYDVINKNHVRRLAAAEKRFAEGKRTRLIETMRSELAKAPAPTLKPRGAQTELSPRERKKLLEAVPDYLDGKETVETRKYAALLVLAAERAEKKEPFAKQAALAPVSRTLQREKDQFFRACEKERRLEAASEKVQGDFARARRGPAAPAFNKASGHESWRNAVGKAAQQESQRDQDFDKNLDKER